MKEYMNYIIFLVVSLIFFIIYLILLKIEKKHVKAFYEKQKEKIIIVNDLIQLESKIKKKQEELSELRYLSIYLSQVNNIIDENGFDIEGIKVLTLKKFPENHESDFNKTLFIQEYLTAKKSVINLVDRCSDILGRIYSLNHPIKYSIIELKKILLLRKLTIIAEFKKKTRAFFVKITKILNKITWNETVTLHNKRTKNKLFNQVKKYEKKSQAKSFDYSFIQPLSA